MSKKPPARRPVRREPEPVEITAAPVPWWRLVLREPLALGLAIPILVRPWLDGITYPTDNFYFIWAILLLLALWGVRLLFRGDAIRFGTPVLLLVGFYGVAALTALVTVQFDATYRSMILWAGHVALFIIVTNGLRSRTAVGVVLTAFVVSELTETVWGLVHFRYVLPYVRDAVVHDPVLLKIYFGSMEPGPELIHRLQVNRAFGSLLFPNALAAFLILGIPYAAAGSLHSVSVLLADIRSWRAARAASSGKIRHDAGTPLSVVATGLIAWFVAVSVLYFLFSFIASFEFPIEPAMRRLGFLPLVDVAGTGFQMDSASFVALWGLFVALAPGFIAVGCAFVVSRHGLSALGHVLRVACFPPLAVYQVGALWLTYSRGGLLALIVAVLLTAGILMIGRKFGPAAARTAGLAAAAAGLVVVLGISGPGFGAPGDPGATPVPAQTQQTQLPSTEPASPAPVSQPGTPQPAMAGSPPRSAINQITREGVDLGIQDLMNPTSLRLRLSYWRTGLRMASFNLLTGVGLGNFGTAYPKYQRPGAGDVKAAHNDYLQALCETGLLGFAFFCAFWGYFAWWGARRLIRETNRYDRWILTGLYTGVMAFLIHSAIDFNFFNPALAFFVILMAGLFYARSAPAESKTETKPRNQLFGIPVLIGVALITGMAARVYLCDFMVGGHNLINVGNHRKLNEIFDSGIFFVRDLGLPQTAGKYPMKDIMTAAKLIPERSVLQSFGDIRVPTGGGENKYRPLQPNEQVPPTAKFVVTKPKEGQAKALEYVDRFLKSLTVADGVYPHSPDLAGYFIQWYEMLAQYALDPSARQRYVGEFLRWAETGVKRSPGQAAYREWFAKALWARANIDPGPERWEFFAKSVLEYGRSAHLLPSAAYMWDRYADACTKYGEALIESGQKEQGETQIVEGRKANGWANVIRAKQQENKLQ